jgi:hypothetical protein
VILTIITAIIKEDLDLPTRRWRYLAHEHAPAARACAVEVHETPSYSQQTPNKVWISLMNEFREVGGSMARSVFARVVLTFIWADVFPPWDPGP